MGGGRTDLLVLQRRDGDVEVLLLRAVVHWDLHSAAGDAHGEIELGAHAAVLVALRGAAAPGAELHALDGVDAALSGDGNNRLAVLGGDRFRRHGDGDGLRLILVKNRDGHGVYVLADGPALTGVFEHQQDLSVTLRRLGIQRGDHQEFGVLPGLEAQSIFSAGVAVLCGGGHVLAELLPRHEGLLGHIGSRQRLPVGDRAGGRVPGRQQRRRAGELRFCPFGCFVRGFPVVLRSFGLRLIRRSFGLRLIRRGLGLRFGDGIAVLVHRCGADAADHTALTVHDVRAADLIEDLAHVVLAAQLDFFLPVGVLGQLHHGEIRDGGLRRDLFLIDLHGVVHVVLGGQVDDLQGHLGLRIQVACPLDRDVELFAALFADAPVGVGDEKPVFTVRERLRHGQLDLLRRIDRLVDLVHGVGHARLAGPEQNQDGKQHGQRSFTKVFHRESTPC